MPDDQSQELLTWVLTGISTLFTAAGGALWWYIKGLNKALEAERALVSELKEKDSEQRAKIRELEITLRLIGSHGRPKSKKEKSET